MDGFIGREHLSEAANKKQLVFQPKVIRIERCRGCLSCVLACSFHHKKFFSLTYSSISVVRNNQNGIVRWAIDSTCDDCDGETEPLCQKYCAYDVVTVLQDDPSGPEKVKIEKERI